MGGNKINMAVGAELTRRRTNCGRERVESRSTWSSVLNAQDDAQAAGENEWKFNMTVSAEFTRRTLCGRE